MPLNNDSIRRVIDVPHSEEQLAQPAASRWARTAQRIEAHPKTSTALAAVAGLLIGASFGGGGSTAPVRAQAPAQVDVAALESELQETQEELNDALGAVDDEQQERFKAERRGRAVAARLRSTQRNLARTKADLRETLHALTAVAAPAAPAASAECDPNYTGTCVPVVSYDLNCDDIAGSVTVVGSDPHGFDGDGDGSGCE